MSCEELRDIYELYALGALEAGDRTEVDAHLGRGCADCLDGIKRALATNALIVAFAPDVEPPARLRRKLLAAIGAERAPRGFSWAWAAVCAALLAAVVWSGADIRRRAADLAEARQQLAKANASLSGFEQARALLNQPDTRQVVFGKGQPQPTHGSVFVNPRGGVLLLASNLPPAPAGKTYEMWLIPKSGAPKPAGLFQSGADGSALHLNPGPIEANTAAVAVSLEPAAGSAAPTNIVIAPVAIGT